MSTGPGSAGFQTVYRHRAAPSLARCPYQWLFAIYSALIGSCVRHIAKTIRNHRKINKIVLSSLRTKTLTKPCKNQHFAWSVSGETGPRTHPSWSRCSRHGRRPATKVGNTRFPTAPPWCPPGARGGSNGAMLNKQLNNSEKIHKNH